MSGVEIGLVQDHSSPSGQTSQWGKVLVLTLEENAENQELYNQIV